jgi:hypothetical protein
MRDPKCVPRRELLAVLVGASAALTLGTDRPASAQQKLSQQDAAYQDTPKDDHACGTCTLFQPPKSCKIVAGDISDHGWCKLFEESPE